MAFLGVAGITLFVITLVITFFAEMSDDEHKWRCSKDVVAFETNFL